MGLTFARFYAEMDRSRARLVAAREEVATGAISGAVGTFANIDPRVEEHVCEKLGLKPEPVSTQVIPRDRHAMFFATLGVIASSIENVAIEIRHMQRTEVLEAEEYFSPGQKGSSAMPHKRNPVLTENLTGLSRLVRMAVIPAMENVALWHERDISHSSVERGIGPDTTIHLDFALNRLAGVIERIRVMMAPQPAATTTPVSNSREGVQLPLPWARPNTSSVASIAPANAEPDTRKPPTPASMASNAPTAAPPDNPNT